MGAGLKRARAAARATQLRWWTQGTDGLHWWLKAAPGDEAVGEVKFCTDISGKAAPWWYAAKLAVRRVVRR